MGGSSSLAMRSLPSGTFHRDVVLEPQRRQQRKKWMNAATLDTPRKKRLCEGDLLVRFAALYAPRIASGDLARARTEFHCRRIRTHSACGDGGRVDARYGSPRSWVS